MAKKEREEEVCVITGDWNYIMRGGYNSVWRAHI
jgi:hypothetical protein